MTQEELSLHHPRNSSLLILRGSGSKQPPSPQEQSRACGSLLREAEQKGSRPCVDTHSRQGWLKPGVSYSLVWARLDPDRTSVFSTLHWAHEIPRHLNSCRHLVLGEFKS
jgi:hypothetical protein